MNVLASIPLTPGSSRFASAPAASLWETYARLHPREKRRWITTLGCAVRCWHDAGEAVASLAAIRVTGEAGEPAFELATAVTRRPGHAQLAGRQRLRALGGLLAACWMATSRSERYRFLTAYMPDGASLGLRQRAYIERHAWRMLRAAWKGRVRQSFVAGAGFCAGRIGGFRYLGAGRHAMASLEALLPDPDAVLDKGRIYKPGTRTHAGMVTLMGTPRFLKRINYRGWRYGMKYILRRSRAVHNWKIMWALRYRQVPVADPILCLEERIGRFLKRSYILTDFAQGKEPLKAVWPALAADQRLTLLVRLADLLGRMHRFGGLHGDLKWSNILVDASAAEVTLVDFDGSRILRNPTAKRAHKDIDRFLKDLKRVDPSERWVRIFYQSWHKWITGLQ